MIKKEFHDILWQLFYFCLLLIYIFLMEMLVQALRSQPFDFEIYLFIASFGIMGFSMFLGFSAFSNDHKQKALEYILTLPISRNQLFWAKLAPRLTLIAVFSMLFWLLSKICIYSSLSAMAMVFCLITTVLFIVSFSLSSSAERLIVLLILSCFATLFLSLICWLIVATCLALKSGLIYLSFIEFYKMVKEFKFGESAFFITIIMIMFSILISFYFSFTRFDIRSSSRSIGRQFKYFISFLIPSIILSFSICYIGINEEQWWHELNYLTQKNQIIKNFGHLRYLYIYGENSVHWINNQNILWYELLLDDNQYLYFWAKIKNANDYYADNLVRLDTINLKYELLYHRPGKDIWDIPFHFFRYHGEKFALLEGDMARPSRQEIIEHTCLFEVLKSNNLNLITIDKKTSQVTRIRFISSLLNNYCGPSIFGTDKINGRQFWLIYPFPSQTNNLLRIWEDGHVDALGSFQGVPCYQNHLLFFYSKNSLEIHQPQESGTRMIKKIEAKELMPLCNSSKIQDVPEMIIAMDNKICAQDLSNLSLNIHEIGLYKDLKLYRSIYYTSPQEAYYLESMGNEAKGFKIYRIKDRKMILLKQFENAYWVSIENTGIIVKEENKSAVYAFPDLHELKFKYLR